MDTELKNLIDKLNKALADDLPKSLLDIFSKAADRFLQAHDLRSLSDLVACCVMSDKAYYIKRYFYNDDNPADNILQAANAGAELAAQHADQMMEAIFHFLTGKWVELGWDADHEEEALQYAMAMANPAILAETPISQFPWIRNTVDSHIFGNNLLAFIGLETKNYDALYEFYRHTDNRAATCYSLIHKTIADFANHVSDDDDYDDDAYDDDDNYMMDTLPESDDNSDDDKKDKARQFKILMNVIRQYDDIPVVCDAVSYVYNQDILPLASGTGLAVENENARRKYDFLKTYIDRFDNDPNSAELKILLKKLTAPMFSTDYFDQTVSSNHAFTAGLKFRNVESLYLNVYNTPFTGKDYLPEYFGNDQKELLLQLTKDAPAYSKTYKYDVPTPYTTCKTTIQMEGLPLGIYLIEMKADDNKPVYKFLYVSDIVAIVESLPDNKIRIAVVNNITGHPATGACVDILDDDEKTMATLKCDNHGEVVWQYQDFYDFSAFFPYTQDDKFCRLEHKYHIHQYEYTKERSRPGTEILTDRGIYRPGQTVHVAVVRYQVEQDRTVKMRNEAVEIKLEKRGKVLGQQRVRLNAFGVAHCDFVIPEDTEPGEYEVSCNWNSHYIRIEEYKRPTFEVTMDPYKQTYKPGDTIFVEGTACSLAGVPVANCKVNYRVKRALAWWWRWWAPYWEQRGTMLRYGEGEYFSGSATTDETGHFRLEVPMMLPQEKDGNGLCRPLALDIVVEADVVDATGETQYARTSLPLSNQEYFMHINMQKQFESAEQVSFTVDARNATGQDVEREFEYWIDESKEPIPAKANQAVELNGLTTGIHILHVNDGREEMRHEFCLFSKDATAVPYKTEKWTYLSSSEFPENGEDVILQIGCADPDTYIFYNLFSGNTLLESGAEYAPTGMINRRFAYKDAYGNALLISYAWVRNKKLQKENFVIKKPLPKRELKIEWKSFRDRVTPGTDETWTLTVKDLEGRNVSANVVATLYDKALDQLSSNSWSGFGPILEWNSPSAEWGCETTGKIGLNFLRFRRTLNFALLAKTRNRETRSFGRLANPGNAISRADMESQNMNLDVGARSCFEANAPSAGYACAPMASPGEDETPQITLRADMAETAFFMPTLRTDENGEVNINFHLPDSLTTWRFMAVAHTKDMYHAFFEDETVARKLVMLKPNMPRFVRVGDITTIAANLSNMAGRDLSGKVVCELLNAKDEKQMYSETRDFTLDNGQSTAFTFAFTPDEEVKDYICRIYAVGEGFSDGEQHLLHVLSDKAEVTVTQVVTQDGPGTETVNMAEMLPDNTSRHELSLQYTNNPIWLAIKALPEMRNPKSHDAISLAVAIYCSVLTDFLQRKVEKFGNIQLADAKVLAKHGEKLLEKLKNLQGKTGGFRWYKSMPESFYMTAEVVMHLGRLQMITGATPIFSDILGKAFRFCDQEMVEHVKWLKKREAEGLGPYFPTFSVLQHMYNCAVARRHLDGSSKAAFDYLMPLLKKDIHIQTIYEKAMAAVILEYAGEHYQAMTYCESLRQHMEYDPKRGMTFKTRRASFSWYSYKIPTHVAGLEVLQLLFPADRTTILEMQKWLLNEKRTQAWDTPIDSVNAVHALLIGAEGLLSDRQTTQFYADGVRLEVEAKENEGCVQTELAPDTKQLEMVKPTNGLAWGAVFAQFLQPMADVEESGSGMTIKREVFTADGLPLTNQTVLHVGDRIRTRLTFTCERNFDFVTVTDSKAACMEPVCQFSRSDSFVQVIPLDTETRYCYYGLGEGTHSIENDFFIDRPGTYQTGLATIVCTYAPEFRATCPSQCLTVSPQV